MIGVPCNQAIVSRRFSGLNSDISAISAVVERRSAKNRNVSCCPLVVDEMFSRNERAIVRASEVSIAFRETEIAFLEKKTTGLGAGRVSAVSPRRRLHEKYEKNYSILTLSLHRRAFGFFPGKCQSGRR